MTGRDTEILVITMFANQRKVLEAVRAGARRYLSKDERIEDCIDRSFKVFRITDLFISDSRFAHITDVGKKGCLTAFAG